MAKIKRPRWLTWPKALRTSWAIAGQIIAALPILTTLYRWLDAWANTEFLVEKVRNMMSFLTSDLMLGVLFIIGIVIVLLAVSQNRRKVLEPVDESKKQGNITFIDASGGAKVTTKDTNIEGPIDFAKVSGNAELHAERTTQRLSEGGTESSSRIFGPHQVNVLSAGFVSLKGCADIMRQFGFWDDDKKEEDLVKMFTDTRIFLGCVDFIDVWEGEQWQLSELELGFTRRVRWSFFASRGGVNEDGVQYARNLALFRIQDAEGHRVTPRLVIEVERRQEHVKRDEFSV